jgi:hypothetical protein
MYRVLGNAEVALRILGDTEKLADIKKEVNESNACLAVLNGKFFITAQPPKKAKILYRAATMKDNADYQAWLKLAVNQ